MLLLQVEGFLLAAEKNLLDVIVFLFVPITFLPVF